MRKAFVTACAISTVILLTVSAAGMRLPMQSLEAQTREADLVVVATVAEQGVAWAEDQSGRHIWTTFRVEVSQTFKGKSPEAVFTYRAMGGTADGVREEVFDGGAHPSPGESILLLHCGTDGQPLAVLTQVPVVEGNVTVMNSRIPLAVFAHRVRELLAGRRTRLLDTLGPVQALALPSDAPVLRGPMPGQPASSGGAGWNQHSAITSPPRLTRSGNASQPTHAKAFIADARWTDVVDADGDGYPRSATLVINSDAMTETGSLLVEEQISQRRKGAADWSYVGRTDSHLITGWATEDAIYVPITGTDSPHLSEFLLAVFQGSSSTWDGVRGPTEDPDLDNVPFEGAAYDQPAGPFISSVTPAMTSAGTNSHVAIQGAGFGATQGNVAFLFKMIPEGPVPVLGEIQSWSDTQIVTTVPVCRYAQGECGGYPGSASSGGIAVSSSQGALSNYAQFAVSFGYGGARWNPAQISYRIANSVPSSFGLAIEAAFQTWTESAGIAASFAGAASGSSPSQNGMTELFYGPLPPETDPNVIAQAMCWVPGATTVSECDILFNSAMPWSTAVPTPALSFDVETIALHEIGHWLKLKDLYGNVPGFPSDEAKVMFGINGGGPDGMKRSLHTDDVAGAQWIYGLAQPCSYGVSPLSASLPVEGGSTTVTVTTTANCSWSSTSNATWLTITSGTSETGSGSTTIAVARNTSQDLRVGTVTVAGQTVQIGQAGPSPTCAYGVSPPSAVVPALGGNLDISISTDDGCAWSVTSNASWITITAGSSGTGDGTASITVDSNSGALRSGTLTIVDRTVQLTQEAGGSCNLPGAFVLSTPANGSSLPAPTATLFWASSSGASEYDVYFGSSTSPALLRTVSTTSTQVSIATGTTYHWRVVAKNACGSTASPATGTWSFAVSGGCNLPGEFDLTSPAEGAVARAALLTLTWAPASGATGYDVYFSTKNPPTTRLNSTTATATMVFGDLGTTYFWKVVATNACGTRESRIGSFRVRRADETLVYLLPSAAHVPGTNDTSWRTDVSMVNPGAETAVYSMLYQSMSDALQGTLSGSLAGHETVVWRDVLVKGFNLPPTVATKGTIRVESDMPLVLIARTYNETPSGTFGQEFPALCPIHALPAGKIGIIPHLSNNAAFRVNVGAVNLSAVNPCSVRFRVMDPLGRQVGQNVNLDVPAGRYLQRDRLFDAAGAGSLDLAYATVEVMTSDCAIWPFASIVDNATGDPTTIPAQWVP